MQRIERVGAAAALTGVLVAGCSGIEEPQGQFTSYPMDRLERIEIGVTNPSETTYTTHFVRGEPGASDDVYTRNIPLWLIQDVRPYTETPDYKIVFPEPLSTRAEVTCNLYEQVAPDVYSSLSTALPEGTCKHLYYAATLGFILVGRKY